MPFRAAFANPIVFATLTVIAIGIITYQILKNKRAVPTRGRVHYRSIDNVSRGPDNPDKSSGNFDDGDDEDGNTKGNACNRIESKNSSDMLSGVRKRSVATQNADTSKANNVKRNCSEGISHSPAVSISNDENSDLASDSSVNRESHYPSQRNREMQKEFNDISQVNSNNTFVTNLNGEDSDSSESNNLKVQPEKNFVANIEDEDSDSSESNDSLQIDNNNMDLGKSICSVAPSFGASKSEDIQTPSLIDSFEENYKRDICRHLKTDLEGESSKEKKCYKYSSDEESDTSENNFSAISDESSASCAFKKPELCKGCLEEFANAVAYPCKHCYLCLDCAVKVHRIFKKCTICSSVIKTFEQLKM